MRSNEWQAGRNRRTGVLAAAGAALMLTAAGAQAAGCKQDPDQPKCSGGGGGGESTVSLVTTFDCPAGVGGASCPTSAWQSVSGSYSDGTDDVKSRLTTSGSYVLTMHENQRQAGTRKVAWNLASGTAGPVTLPNGVSFSTTGELDDLKKAGSIIDHKTVIQVGKFSNADLRDMAPGDELTNVDMILDLIVFRERRDGGNSALWVRYADSSTGQCPAGSGASGVTVTRSDDGSGPMAWTVSVPAGTGACLYDAGTTYGDYDFGTLTLYLEAL